MPANLHQIAAELPPDRPILIAGPTASGKSALALAIAEQGGGTIVNADALQVWSCWRALSARPAPADEARVPHALYGHRAPGQDYSVGHWLREVTDLIAAAPKRRLIIVGGTGLYLTALTEGLADIPPTPAAVRRAANALREDRGHEAMLADIDPVTLERIDRLNPMRIQRAWEVQQATGRGLAAWQDATGPALVPLARASALVLDSPRDWLAARIARRFDVMLDDGALDEARAVLDIWDPAALWAKAIGAPELVAHLRGELTLAEARDAAVVATRRYAKRQRTWFRARMGGWRRISLA